MARPFRLLQLFRSSLLLLPRFLADAAAVPDSTPLLLDEMRPLGTEPARACALLVCAPGANASLATALLCAGGYQAVAATDAVSLAEAFVDLAPQLIVLDVAPGWADGAALAASIARRWPDPLVILLGDPAGATTLPLSREPRMLALVPATVPGFARLADLALQHGPGVSTADVAVDDQPELSMLRRRVSDLQDQLQAARADAARADAARADAERPDPTHVAAEVAHDLHEPLRSAVRMVDELEGALAERGRPADRAVLADLREQVLRLQDMVDSALASVRLATPMRRASDTDAEDVLRAVLASLSASMDDTSGIVTHDPLPVVSMPRHELRRVLQNLVANALRHGGEAPVVHVSATRQGDNWVFSVKDNGPGIPADEREAVFRPLVRSPSGQWRGGAGLGLSITRKLVERAGGRIWLESVQPTGSVFRFALPIDEMVEDDADTRSSAGSGGST